MFGIIAAIIVFVSAVSSGFAAERPNLEALFQGRSGCFILYDLATDKEVVRYGGAQCVERVTPCCSFNILIAAMAFSQPPGPLKGTGL